MKRNSAFLFVASLATSIWAQDIQGNGNRFIAENSVTWTSLGSNENDSMPIGNGDLAANVWTEQNGDVVLLVAKADAWTETGKLVKLGRVRIQLNPNPFVGTTNISQTLKLDNSSIELKCDGNIARIWMSKRIWKSPEAFKPVWNFGAKRNYPTNSLWKQTTRK